MKFAVLATGAAALCCIGAGCNCSRGPGGSPIGAGAELFPPDQQPQPITLNLGGIVMNEAMMELESSGSRRILSLTNLGQVIEREVYEVDGDGISLVGFGSGDGDRFDPPLTLIRFPAREGDKIDWSGSQRFGDTRGVAARATSTTQTELVSLATGSAQAIRVEVDLVLEDSSPQPAKRRLQFWFVNGSGPVKRDFGLELREPRLPAEPKTDPGEG